MIGAVVLPYDDVGEGPVVVLLHAGIADRSMWREHLEPLAAAGHRVIALDLPGFGEAPVPAAMTHWLDVIETLEALGIERSTLVGNSFGAAVALRVAVVAPEKVGALVLAAPSAEAPEVSPAMEAVWEAEEAALERGDVDGAVTAVLDGWVRDARIRDRVAEMQRRTFEKQLAAPGPAPAPDPVEDDWSVVAAVRVPVLVIEAELDHPDSGVTAAMLERTVTRVRRETVAGAGHLVPLEAPDEFRSLVLGFLAEQ
jgi:pimeloyl-ACP methyl ester carboxylesterase